MKPDHRAGGRPDGKMGSDPGPALGCGLGGLGSGQALLFQEHEGQAAELLPVLAGDDGLLVGLGDGHRIAHTQFALFDQHGVAERQKLRILDQPVGNLDAGDLGAAVEVVEVAPLLAGGQSQGEARRQWLERYRGERWPGPSTSSNSSRSSKPAAPSQDVRSEWRAVQRRLQSPSPCSQSMRRRAPATSVVRGREV